MPGVVMHFLSLTFLIPANDVGLNQPHLEIANFTPYMFIMNLFLKEINSPPPQA
jgi:hypothetical protein